jgi:2-polyprenyl-6-methoxyphenol hydroxylase-like FAD-dependent oxidoreductase
VDVLIVGAGFTGLTAAREIMRDTPEKKVMVVDANEAIEKKTYKLLTSVAKPNSYEFYEQSKVREKLNAPQVRAAIFVSVVAK